MLILTRKVGQSILIGNEIEVIITAVEGEQIKVGIRAPQDMAIFRKEVLEAIRESNKEAAVKPDLETLKRMTRSPS
jgi:carbon storage regulator